MYIYNSENATNVLIGGHCYCCCIELCICIIYIYIRIFPFTSPTSRDTLFLPCALKFCWLRLVGANVFNIAQGLGLLLLLFKLKERKKTSGFLIFKLIVKKTICYAIYLTSNLYKKKNNVKKIYVNGFKSQS